jgi:hypothetical protein
LTVKEKKIPIHTHILNCRSRTADLHAIVKSDFSRVFHLRFVNKPADMPIGQNMRQRVKLIKYLGLQDNEDGRLENTVRARIIRMEYRFKQFQGRVLNNRQVDVEPRLNVFKTVVITNGVYACETWNYTTSDIARIERHYFRLLRDVLLIPKTDEHTNFLSVMDNAAAQGIDSVFPMECLIQRQQLKFLWKLVHLDNTAIQKIVMFGKVENKGVSRKGGRKQSYHSCMNLALSNFNVSMRECLEMTQKDWDFQIDNQSLLEAVAKWRTRPAANKPIDNFWAPQIKARGKRKVIMIEEQEEENEEVEEEGIWNRNLAEVAVDSIPGGGIAGAAAINENINNIEVELVQSPIADYRSKRYRRSFKRLRRNVTHQDNGEESTQDFPGEEDNHGAEDIIATTNVEEADKQEMQRRRILERVNRRAADEFLAQLITYQPSGDTIEEEAVGSDDNEVDSSRAGTARNYRKRQRRNAAAKKKKQSGAIVNSVGSSLQIILGEETSSNNFNSNEESINWAHRAILGRTRF